MTMWHPPQQTPILGHAAFQPNRVPGPTPTVIEWALNDLKEVISRVRRKAKLFHPKVKPTRILKRARVKKGRKK